MERPDEPALDALDATIANIAAHEARIAELKQRLREETRQLENIQDPPRRLAAAIYAYWYLPEVRVDDLAWAVVKSKAAQHKFRELAGPVVTGINCDRCGDRLPITSRTQMKEVLERHRENRAQFAEGYRAVCEPCHEATMEERRDAYDRAERQREQNAAKLRRLPYADYLATEHWRRRRAMHLEQLDWMYRRGHHECDVCKRQGDLDVYHKTVASVAREHSDDLMLLCETCCKVLVVAGRIVPAP